MKYGAKITGKPVIILSGAISNKINYLNFKNKHKISKKLLERILQFYRGFLYKKADSLLSYGELGKKFFLSYGINKSKIFSGTQNYPESLLPKSAWKSKPSEYKNKKIIFNIGYLNQRKGVGVLIKAFNKLNRKDTLLLIAGTGEKEDKLKELAKDNKNIIFLGYKDGIDKANYYSIADLFVFPTLHDCWGLVINESFYYGIPVISTNKAGAKELIEEGKTGFIVPDKDVDALANKMELLLDNPKLLKRMKKNVKKIPKSKIVEVNTTVKTFDKAIKYALKNQHNHAPHKT